MPNPSELERERIAVEADAHRESLRALGFAEFGDLHLHLCDICQIEYTDFPKVLCRDVALRYICDTCTKKAGQVRGVLRASPP